MTIAAALLGEHALLYTQFDYVEQALLDRMTLSQVHCQAGMLRAALESHAHLEDELLFAPLEPYLGEANPLAMMRGEHCGIERALATLPRIVELSRARAGLLFVIEVARRHCAREEQAVYSLATTLLGSEESNRLCDRWAVRRGISQLR
ncbi:MAG: hemerythrin domain-containing protein [Caldilineaceae bacterium]|nr:hemerythrin domain-containing protein [Caldilineaceae bacterium]